MKIKEALDKWNELAEKRGEKKKTEIHLGQRIWPDSSLATQRMNISNLTTGKTQTFKEDWVLIICEELDCDANELFGVKKRKH
jgi:hypothetical protein